MNDKAAYAKRAVTLRKIVRFKARLRKFRDSLDEIITCCEKIEEEHKNECKGCISKY